MEYGMFTEYGNRVIDGVVIAAKELGWNLAEVIDVLDDIASNDRFAEARDTEVRELVYQALFKEAA